MDSTRARYIAALKQGVSEASAEGRDLVTEVRLQLKRQYRRDLYSQYVIDALERKADGTVGAIEFRVDPHPATWPDLVFDSEVVWNSVTFRCDAADFPEDAVVSWGERWIHDESPAMGPQDGLTGIIHSVCEPVVLDDSIELSIDLGSAPMAAFEEIVAVLGSRLRSVGSDLVEAVAADEESNGRRDPSLRSG